MIGWPTLKRRRSARRMLTIALVAMVGLVTSSAALLSWREGRIEANELFDAKLAHSARVLAALADPHIDAAAGDGAQPIVVVVWHGTRSGQGDALVTAAGHAYETRLAFQVRNTTGQLLLRSDSGPNEPLAALTPGFVDRQIDGEAWRVFTLRSARAHWVQAAERSDIRAELATDIAHGTLLPLLLALPVLALLVWLVVSWASRGLVRISAQVEQRAANSLEPLSDTGVPEELHGLVAAIDGLLRRLREALARERRFIADAAHELRTPLAALRVHAANLRNAPDAMARAHSQRRVEDGIIRMERLVAQLLELERQENQAGSTLQATAVDLVGLARREIAELGVAGLARGITLSLEAPDQGPMHGEETGLAALLRNLIDNALRYTPTGGAVTVSIAAQAGGWLLRIDDSGPGIAAAERQAALARFHRGLGLAASGSGLGLSIVQRVVERHRGQLQLESSPLGGLRVEVHLPSTLTESAAGQREGLLR